MKFNSLIDDAYFQACVNADKLKNMLKREGYTVAADELDRVLYYFAADADKALESWTDELVRAYDNDADASDEAKDALAERGVHFVETDSLDE